jgi:hypothetical protein
VDIDRVILVAVILLLPGLLIALLKALPPNPIVVVALTWLGPKPVIGEKLSSYQFRRAAYSASWLAQIVVLLCTLWLVSTIWPTVTKTNWWQAFLFALPIGAAIALLAVLGFLLSAAKARCIGPDVTYGPGIDSSSEV